MTRSVERNIHHGDAAQLAAQIGAGAGAGLSGSLASHARRLLLAAAAHLENKIAAAEMRAGATLQLPARI